MLTVVQSCGHRPGANIVRVSGRPSNVDGVAVRVAQQNCDERISRPLLNNESIPSIQCNDAGECPKRLEDADQSALVQFLAYPRDSEQSDDMRDARRDDEELHVEGAEAEGAECQSEICLRRTLRDEANEAEEVDRPQVVVFQRIPEPAWCDCLPVVHIALARVVPQYSVDNNSQLAVCEPALGPVPRFCLDSRSRHEEERCHADEECEQTFEQEQPSPASQAIHLVQMKDSEGEERGGDGCHAEGGPEEAETDGQFPACVEVGEP